MAPAGIGDRVEGLNAVKAAARAGRVVEAWVERSRVAANRDLIELVTSTGGKVHQVESVVDRADSQTPQGVVAACRPLAVSTLEDLATGQAALAVLDHVIDPHNLGAIARSALAAGMTGLVASTRRAAPFSATTFKAASGAFEHLPVARVSSIPDALLRLKRLGVWTVGLDTGGESELFGLALLAQPVAIVVGGEGGGLSHLARQRLDVLARIPMGREAESLNASVAAAIAFFEVMRVRAS